MALHSNLLYAFLLSYASGFIFNGGFLPQENTSLAFKNCSWGFWTRNISCSHSYPYDTTTDTLSIERLGNVITYSIQRGSKVWFKDSVTRGQNKTTCMNWTQNESIQACLFSHNVTLPSYYDFGVCFQLSVTNLFVDMTFIDLGCFNSELVSGGESQIEAPPTINQDPGIIEAGKGYFSNCEWLQPNNQIICSNSYENGQFDEGKRESGSCMYWPQDDSMKMCWAGILQNFSTNGFSACFKVYQRFIFAELGSQDVNCFNATYFN